MALASKLLSQECSCEEFLARAKDQLLSNGKGMDVDDSFESFNVVRSTKFNHHLREKGREEKLSSSAPTSPQVVKQRPHPSINSKLAGPKVCQKGELLNKMSLVELYRVLTHMKCWSILNIFVLRHETCRQNIEKARSMNEMNQTM